MATHSSVLAWRIPGTGEPSGLPPMESHRVGHHWSDLAAAAAAVLRSWWLSWVLKADGSKKQPGIFRPGTVKWEGKAVFEMKLVSREQKMTWCIFPIRYFNSNTEEARGILPFSDMLLKWGASIHFYMYYYYYHYLLILLWTLVSHNEKAKF